MLFFSYDYLITLSDEVHFIWQRPKRRSSYWFLLNRYLAFSTNFIMAFFTFGNFGMQVRSSARFILPDG